MYVHIACIPPQCPLDIQLYFKTHSVLSKHVQTEMKVDFRGDMIEYRISGKCK